MTPQAPMPPPTMAEYLEDWDWLMKESAVALRLLREAAAKDQTAAVARCDGQLQSLERLIRRIETRRKPQIQEASKLSRA